MRAREPTRRRPRPSRPRLSHRRQFEARRRREAEADVSDDTQCGQRRRRLGRHPVRKVRIRPRRLVTPQARRRRRRRTRATRSVRPSCRRPPRAAVQPATGVLDEERGMHRAQTRARRRHRRARRVLGHGGPHRGDGVRAARRRGVGAQHVPLRDPARHLALDALVAVAHVGAGHRQMDQGLAAGTPAGRAQVQLRPERQQLDRHPALPRVHREAGE
mmetsp:Transcript_9605/g.38875  ORF Transcript_9605/g.38875 Transcript_9605/m.38875 type:complete len:217 (+) Transcript_9605:203-853(+)